MSRHRHNEKVNDALSERAKTASIQLSAIVESSDDAIISKNLNGIISSWNHGAENVFGYAEQEAIGRPMQMLIPPERADEEPEILARISRGERVDHFETVRIRKDGKPVEVSVTISPLRDSSGKIIGASKIARDITERRRMEGVLREREEQLRLYAEYSPAAIAMFDRDMKYLVVSRRWMEVYHLGDQSIVGLSHYKVFPEIPQRWKDVHQRCLKGAIEKCDEEAFLRADGITDWIRWEVRPWRQGDGAIGGIIIFSEDITERKAARDKINQLNIQLEQRVVERTAELEAANKELEAFSYSVSHDLRAPLRAVNGFAEIVLEEYSHQLPEECRRYLERIRNGGQRMGDLIDDLLAFSRVNRKSVNRQIVDSIRLVQNALDELNPQREGREVEIKVGNLPPCHGDPALLKQVWVNLLSNAIKYSRGRKPAVIEIGSNHINCENVYFVKDNGDGFDMQYADKLFNVFQRLHNADEFEGTGVGLAIVQRIVHRHGGRVWAQAEVGHGAAFYFTIGGQNKS